MTRIMEMDRSCFDIQNWEMTGDFFRYIGVYRIAFFLERKKGFCCFTPYRAKREIGSRNRRDKAELEIKLGLADAMFVDLGSHILRLTE